MNRSILALLLLFAAYPAAAFGVDNPGFDDSLNGWDLHNYDSYWDSDDANGSARSGSYKAFVPAGTTVGGPAATQCVTASPDSTLAFSFKVKVQEPGSQVGHFRIFSSSDCSGTPLSQTSIFSDSSSPAYAWATVSTIVQTPATTKSVLLELYVGDQIGRPSQTLKWDDIYFGPAAPSTCTPSSVHLCLDRFPGDKRFIVASIYNTVNGGGLSGSGHAVSLSTLGVGRGGLFWFFDATNPELLVKVLDACPSSGYFWIFVAAGTNAGVDLYVGDTVTGKVAYFHNRDLGSYPTIHNLLALRCN